MKQTSQYKLNQWELTDRVRMEDFNADNAKLETALGGLQTGLNGLITDLSNLNTALSGKSNQLQLIKYRQAAMGEGHRFTGGSLYISPNWNQWSGIIWFYDTRETTFQTGEKMTFALNNSSGTIDASKVTLDAGPVLLALFPLRDKTSLVKGFVLGGAAKPLLVDITYNDLTGCTITLVGSSSTKFHNVTMTSIGF